MKKIIILFLLITYGIIQSSTFVFSQEKKPIAIISSTIGKVQILNNKGVFSRNAQQFTKIFPDEIVSTSNNSACVIVFKDKTTVKLESNTKVLLSKVNVNPQSRRGIGVLKGDVVLNVFKTGQNQFSAFTPTAVAGVRGTSFRISVAADGSSRCQVEEGNVNFSTRESSEDLEAGRYATHNIDNESNSIRTNNDSYQDEQQWKRQREENLKRNPSGTLDKLENEVQLIEQNNNKTLQKVRNLHSSQINRDNAGEVFEVDNEVVEHTARNRAIRETSIDIANRYRNDNRVTQRYRMILQRTNAVEQQINMMDKFIEEMGQKIDKLIEQQEERIDDLMNNFMRRGLRRR